jgi:hypothetical protein
LGTIEQESVLTRKLLIPVVLAGVGAAEDHCAEAAIAYRKRLIPDRRWRTIPEHLGFRPRRLSSQMGISDEDYSGEEKDEFLVTGHRVNVPQNCNG